MEQQTQVQLGGAFPHVSAKIERGQRGGYGWTLGATVAREPGKSLDEALDEQMRSRFGGADLGQAA